MGSPSTGENSQDAASSSLKRNQSVKFGSSVAARELADRVAVARPARAIAPNQALTVSHALFMMGSPERLFAVADAHRG